MWAIILSIALFISDDPWVALCLLIAATIVVYRRADDQPWSKSFNFALRFMAWIVAIRMMIAIFLGVPIPGRTLFTLPTISLPDWVAGVRIGGPVTLERLASTLGEVMIILGVIALFAAATSLTSPHRAIRALPFAFYQLGLILTIATSVFPQLVISLKRIRLARHLRGQSKSGFKNWRMIAMPLLEDALERSLDLAAAMESRGFGQKVRRTRYRADKWQSQDHLIVLSGAATLLIILLIGSNLLTILVIFTLVTSAAIPKNFKEGALSR